jgi:allantoinase
MTPVLDLLIRNADIACPEGLFHGAVGIRGGRIAVLCDTCHLPRTMEAVDAGGALLLPGGVDTHVHLREPACPERGDFASETAAAVAGGITTILEMPISAPPQYSVPILRSRVDLASRASLADFGFYGGAGAEHIDLIPELAAAGVVAFKTFLFHAPEGRESEFEGILSCTDGVLFDVFEAVGRTGRICAVHAENDDIVAAATAKVRMTGRKDFAAHGIARPPLAEVQAVEKILRYAREAGARLSVCHVSTPAAMGLIRDAKRAGRPVYAETCPQYLFRCEEDAARAGSCAKYNPPIRDRASMEGLWPFLTDGTVDYIGSDHGPFLPREKEPGMEDIFLAPAGGVGFEERLPLLLTAVRDGRLALDTLLWCASEKPARAFGLFPRKGIIAPGADADLALVDTEHPFRIDRKRMLTKARDTARLYDGREVVGRVLATWVRGRCVFSNGAADVGARGWGRWLRHSGATKN